MKILDWALAVHLHHEVASGGASAVADLGVIHHAPGNFHLGGQIKAGRWSWQSRRGVSGKQQGSGIMARRVFTEFQFKRILVGSDFTVTLFCAAVGWVRSIFTDMAAVLSV